MYRSSLPETGIGIKYGRIYVVAAIVNQYEIGTECLLYDTTNFFTYIDTKTKNRPPGRGIKGFARYA